jgi:hypothetical protein
MDANLKKRLATEKQKAISALSISLKEPNSRPDCPYCYTGLA